MEVEAKIIAHSKSSVNGKEIITFELQYPRFIHSELMTHRMFSRNAASSRAIPIGKMIEQVRNDPAMPIHFGKNQPGMQAKEELEGFELGRTKARWRQAAINAADMAEDMGFYNAHKQIVNRILEPFQWMKTVVTATEFENFFWLRNHEDAQPEIKRLAEVMLEAKEKSEAKLLRPGDWHVPYYADGCWYQSGKPEIDSQSLKDALAISSSCCAQVSYRALDDSLEKAQMIYKKLVESEPVHASCLEHQATPMEIPECDYWTDAIWEALCQEGTTHMDANQKIWSGNFESWIQYRQIIPNNAKRG